MLLPKSEPCSDFVISEFDPGCPKGDPGHNDDMPLDDLHERHPEARKRADSATTFAYPLFETDFEEDGSESEYTPSRTVSPMSQTMSRSSARFTRAKLSRSRNADVDMEYASYDKVASRRSKQLHERRTRKSVVRSSPHVRKKQFALARIEDNIMMVEVQFSTRSKHILSINERPPLEVLYGFLKHDMSGLRNHDQRIHRMKSDRDIILADDYGSTGRCQGCKKLIQVPRLYRWINHKMRCRHLQSKLREELNMQGDHPSEVEEGQTADSGGNESDNGSGWSRRFEVEQNPMSSMKALTGAFSQNELVSVRVGDKIEPFRYTSAHGEIRLNGKTLSEVFYGTKLPKGGARRWLLFNTDPDIKTFSMVDRTCVCRGCDEKVSIAKTSSWLTHRFQCHILQKHRVLPASAHGLLESDVENTESVSTHLASACKASPSTPRVSSASLKRSYPAKRKHREAFSAGRDEDGTLFAPSRQNPKMRKQAHLNSKQSRNIRLYNGFETTTHRMDKDATGFSDIFQRSTDTEYIDDGAEALEGLVVGFIQASYGVLCKITHFFDENFE